MQGYNRQMKTGPILAPIVLLSIAAVFIAPTVDLESTALRGRLTKLLFVLIPLTAMLIVSRPSCTRRSPAPIVDMETEPFGRTNLGRVEQRPFQLAALRSTATRSSCPARFR